MHIHLNASIPITVNVSTNSTPVWKPAITIYLDLHAHVNLHMIHDFWLKGNLTWVGIKFTAYTGSHIGYYNISELNDLIPTIEKLMVPVTQEILENGFDLPVPLFNDYGINLNSSEAGSWTDFLFIQISPNFSKPIKPLFPKVKKNIKEVVSKAFTKHFREAFPLKPKTASCPKMGTPADSFEEDGALKMVLEAVQQWAEETKGLEELKLTEAAIENMLTHPKVRPTLKKIIEIEEASSQLRHYLGVRDLGM